MQKKRKKRDLWGYSKGTCLWLCTCIHLHTVLVCEPQIHRQILCWFFHVLSQQGNLASESPWSAWSCPAVCWMGTPRSAAGKEAVHSRLHSMNAGTQGEICQSQPGTAEEAQRWFMVCRGRMDKLWGSLRILCAVMTTQKVPGWTLLDVTSFTVNMKPNQFYFHNFAKNTWACESHCSRWHLCEATRGSDSLGFLRMWNHMALAKVCLCFSAATFRDRYFKKTLGIFQ